MYQNKQTIKLIQENSPLLLKMNSLIEQMASAHIPLEEGYEKLIQLVQKSLKE